MRQKLSKEHNIVHKANNYKSLVSRPAWRDQEIHVGGQLLLSLFRILLLYYTTLNKLNKQYKAL